MKKRKSFLIKIAAFIAICFVAVMFVNQFSRISYYNGQIKETQKELDHQQEIKEELDNLKDVYASKEYVEELAREKLGLVRANEKVYIDSNNIESN